MRQPQAQFERDRTALKHYMIGRGFAESLTALGIAERWHVGFRKDKVTPELHHQISGCFNFHNTPIKGLTKAHEQAAYTAFLLHDVLEDYDVTVVDLKQAGISDFSISLVQALTKVKGETDDEFFERLLCHWLVPILKGCDRDNNVLTMQGAFTVPKMKAYIDETRKYILPLLKKASRLFPEHTRSYTALASGIKKQLRIYEGFITALEEKGEESGSAAAQVSQLTAEVDKLRGQLNTLMQVNEDLRKAATTVKVADTLTVLKVNDVAQCYADKLITRTQLTAQLRAILDNPVATLLDGANPNADVISDIKPVDISNTIFKTD